jgi:hypothetical protein
MDCLAIMSDENVLKDPDFLFTLLAAIMKRSASGKLSITEEDILAVDMAEAVGLQYDRVTGTVTLSFITADELAARIPESKEPPRLKLVPEFEDDENK